MNTGSKHSDEARRKMSEAKKGKPHTEKQKAAQAAFWRDNKQTAETRAKLSAKLMGHPVSDEHRASVSAAQKRRWDAYRAYKAATTPKGQK